MVEFGKETFINCINLEEVIYEGLGSSLICGNNVWKNTTLQHVEVSLDFSDSTGTICGMNGRTKGLCTNEDKNCSFTYYHSSKKLLITGEGAMPNYQQANEIPWYSKLSTLETIEINGITSLSQNSLTNTNKMTSLILSDSVSIINSNTFDGAYSLQTVTFHGTKSPICSLNSFPTNITFDIIVPLNYTQDIFCERDLIINSGLCALYENICSWKLLMNGNLKISGSGHMYDYNDDDNKAPWLSNSTRIKTLTVEYGIVSLGQRAFLDCINLETVSLPETLATIGIEAFKGCSLVKWMRIPYQVIKLNGGTFMGCTNLQVIYIASTTSFTFGFGDCWGCSSLHTIYYEGRTIPTYDDSMGSDGCAADEKLCSHLGDISNGVDCSPFTCSCSIKSFAVTENYGGLIENGILICNTKVNVDTYNPDEPL